MFYKGLGNGFASVAKRCFTHAFLDHLCYPGAPVPDARTEMWQTTKSKILVISVPGGKGFLPFPANTQISVKVSKGFQENILI